MIRSRLRSILFAAVWMNLHLICLQMQSLSFQVTSSPKSTRVHISKRSTDLSLITSITKLKSFLKMLILQQKKNSKASSPFSAKRATAMNLSLPIWSRSHSVNRPLLMKNLLQCVKTSKIWNRISLMSFVQRSILPIRITTANSRINALTELTAVRLNSRTLSLLNAASISSL